MYQRASDVKDICTCTATSDHRWKSGVSPEPKTKRETYWSAEVKAFVLHVDTDTNIGLLSEEPEMAPACQGVWPKQIPNVKGEDVELGLGLWCWGPPGSFWWNIRACSAIPSID